VSRVDLDGLAELEEERRFLLRSIADLEREHAAGDLEDEDYLTLKDGYTARAAAVLRAIEEGRSRLPARPAPSPGRRRRTVLVALATVVLAVVAGWLVARTSDTRLDGESATGSVAGGVNQLLSEARLALGRDPVRAIQAYDEVLKSDPDNVEALTYRGWVMVITGDATLVAEGEEYLDRAIAADPDYPDARVFKGIVLRNVHGDADGAIRELERALAADPPADMRALIEGELATLRNG